jgi:acyl-CoA synthetase (AMP-forming)/AMP-acid ligase II
MPIDSHHPPISIPPVDVWDFLFKRTDREYPDEHGKTSIQLWNSKLLLLLNFLSLRATFVDALAVIFVDIASQKKLTFRELRSTSVELGRGLRNKWRWQKGDVMALFSPNSADIAAIVTATHWAGGIICPMNNLYTVGELASVLKSSGAKALTTHLACLQVAQEAALIVGLPANRVILIGDPDPRGIVEHFSSLKDSKSVADKVSINPKEDLAFLVYSSGTTGLPKGVMLSHENIIANILQNNTPEAQMTNWRKDSMISFLPMFHIYGKFNIELSSFALFEH